MNEPIQPTVKVPISKAKFYDYMTKDEAKKATSGTSKGAAPQLLRTLFVVSNVRDSELMSMAQFFMDMGEEEVISHILLTKNTLTTIGN